MAVVLNYGGARWAYGNLWKHFWLSQLGVVVATGIQRVELLNLNVQDSPHSWESIGPQQSVLRNSGLWCWERERLYDSLIFRVADYLDLGEGN